MNGWDEVVSAAMVDAVAAIAKAPGQSDVGELAHLQPALFAALRERFGLRVSTGRKVPALPDWDPQPGGVDVAIGHEGSPSTSVPPQVGIELKPACLWPCCPRMPVPPSRPSQRGDRFRKRDSSRTRP